MKARWNRCGRSDKSPMPVWELWDTRPPNRLLAVVSRGASRQYQIALTEVDGQLHSLFDRRANLRVFRLLAATKLAAEKAIGMTR